MSNPLEAPSQDTGVFWSIERKVAFIIAPVVMALAGALSASLTGLASKIIPGVPVPSGEAIYAVAGAGILGAAGVLHMWLKGRQIIPAALVTEGKAILGDPVAHGVVSTAVEDLEQIAERTAKRVAAEILGNLPTPPAPVVQLVAAQPAPGIAAHAAAPPPVEAKSVSQPPTS